MEEQKTITLARGGMGVCSPVFDPRGSLIVANSQSGSICQVVRPDKLAPLVNTGGSPSSIAVDGEGGFLVGDFAHQALLRRDGDGGLYTLVSDYEGKPLHGPSAVLVDSCAEIS